MNCDEKARLDAEEALFMIEGCRVASEDVAVIDLIAATRALLGSGCGAVRRTERGWAGHFVAASKCRFRRNTLLEKDGRGIVVSTVGSYAPGNAARYEEIGYRRHFETMAFRSDESDAVYHDADVSCEVPISSNTALLITNQNEAFVDNLANDMHEAAVREIAENFDAKWEAGKPYRWSDDNA